MLSPKAVTPEFLSEEELGLAESFIKDVDSKLIRSGYAEMGIEGSIITNKVLTYALRQYRREGWHVSVLGLTFRIDHPG